MASHEVKLFKRKYLFFTFINTCFWNVYLMHLSIRKSNLSRWVKACAVEMLLVSKSKLCFQCPLQISKMIKHWFTLQVPAVQSHLDGFPPCDTSDAGGITAAYQWGEPGFQSPREIGRERSGNAAAALLCTVQTRKDNIYVQVNLTKQIPHHVCSLLAVS